MNPIDLNRNEISYLCEKHNVGKLFAFGSVLTSKFRKESDIDLVVAFKSLDLYDYADNYFNLKFSLEKLFNHNVDLLEDQAINNPFLRQTIDSTKKLIYG